MLIKSLEPKPLHLVPLVEPLSRTSGKELKLLPIKNKTEILFITTFPPRECGIATYTFDLMNTMKRSFGGVFGFNICALQSESERHQYSQTIKYILETDDSDSYTKLANDINQSPAIDMVILQHEFGLFGQHGSDLISMLKSITKPIIIVFHTVLPKPDNKHKKMVQDLAHSARSLIVMTQNSSDILHHDYKVQKSKIKMIPHGTHLVAFADHDQLKLKYGLQGKNVLSTFGFLGSGKSIETTLDALPKIIESEPETIFLIIGKTHPSTIKREGETYREFLTEKMEKLGLQNHVLFVNAFLPLPDLLEYLQLTDIYLFTSKDPNQAVSGTFAYAISCGCPIISTPIPHATEVLNQDTGIIIDFCAPDQLSKAVIRLLKDSDFRHELGLNGLHKMASTSWENSAISHAFLISQMMNDQVTLMYTHPEINLLHIKNMTTDTGMVQFAKIHFPDIETGYTLDDNARALVAMCQHYQFTLDNKDLKFIQIYVDFIERCYQNEGTFLNYVDKNLMFTAQNFETNLEDSNGRAIWSLGYVLSLGEKIPHKLRTQVDDLFNKSLKKALEIHSTRAMAFIIKGLFFANTFNPEEKYKLLIITLAERLQNMYRHESDTSWRWYESYLTYGNGTIPEAMLCAFIATKDESYKKTAEDTFDFLLSITFEGDHLKVISNQTWMYRDKIVAKNTPGGEQPIDVAYTILALKRFGELIKNKGYHHKMRQAFQWFLGDNHLHQIMYNPGTGGCYDGLEENNVNLNQGAESTVSYLMSRMAMEGIY